jgi:hypothetical protein
MDFTAGLMPLDTALTQMLNRITPLSAVETVPLLQAFSRVTAHDLISPLDVPVLITRRWTVMPYVWPTSPTARRCRWRVKRSPDSRSTMPGLPEAVFAS